MKKWVVRFITLLVYNLIVLFVIGWLTPAHVGWGALWAAVVMTVLVIWVRPLVAKWFGSMADKSKAQRTKLGEMAVRALLSVAVAFVVWTVTVLVSGVTVSGWFWGWILPPLILLAGWGVYALINDAAERKTAQLLGMADDTDGKDDDGPDVGASDPSSGH